jgi:urease accessory protein
MTLAASKDKLRRAERIAPAGSWTAEPADTVVLAHDDRHRRRIVLTCESGRQVLLDLAEARQLHDGDGLVVDEGAIIAVRAAAEALAEVRCRDPQELARIAWHLGNRHLPTQILGDALRFRDDHVIVDMVRGLGAEVTKITAPFEPEGGAYAHHSHGAPVASPLGPMHGHHHHHGHDHDH